jgi:hypothetical protein
VISPGFRPVPPAGSWLWRGTVLAPSKSGDVSGLAPVKPGRTR